MDTLERCEWVKERNALYVKYHDEEWGVPVYDDVQLFEMLILEGAQAGLSFETILNKREHYRLVYEGFDPKKVALFTDEKVNLLLNDPGIVRNKRKIMASVENAKIFLEIQKEYGSFSTFLWTYVDDKPIVNHPKTLEEVPVETEISKRLSKDLKKRGMKFVGPTIMYAYMQAIGMVDDHIETCICKSGGVKDENI